MFGFRVLLANYSVAHEPFIGSGLKICYATGEACNLVIHTITEFFAAYCFKVCPEPARGEVLRERTSSSPMVQSLSC